jgi:signal transduction histidine kinase
MNDMEKPNHLDILSEEVDKLAHLNLPEEAGAALAQIQQSVAQVSLELIALQTELDAVRQDKSRFVSLVTHELRVPLTSIKGYTDLMRQGMVGPVNDQQKNFLNVIRNNVERMSALISDLSDMSHIQSGKFSLNPMQSDIAAALDDLLLIWKSRFDEKQQTLTVEVADHLPSANLDLSRYKQITAYLLSNAQKYTPEKGSITLRVYQKAEMLATEVSDNGIGIDKKDQEKLFTPFFRSEDSAVREFPGWGLALHVASQIIKLMGGDIGCTSKLGHGSTFWFHVPLQQT